MRPKKILHIAPMNISGVPGELVLAERRLGFESRLVTLYRDRRGYFEDICLNLPFIGFWGTRWIKRRVSAPQRVTVDNRLHIPEKIPLIWQPHTLSEKWLVKLRDRIWWPRIRKAIRKYRLDQFDVYELDGGLDFTRTPRFIPQMKIKGRKIICCYTGSDLRTRGVIDEIDKISALNVTVEFDHLLLHPAIHHVFFPFDAQRFTCHPPKQDPKEFRIGHAPTNWAAKGSSRIIATLQRLQQTYPVKMVLIENLPYLQALDLKASCDIFVDQIGDLGYGINALEALAMGIPTCSCLAVGFTAAYPDHPFVEVQAETLEKELILLMHDWQRRQRLSRLGRSWLEKHHQADVIAAAIHQLLAIS